MAVEFDVEVARVGVDDSAAGLYFDAVTGLSAPAGDGGVDVPVAAEGVELAIVDQADAAVCRVEVAVGEQVGKGWDRQGGGGKKSKNDVLHTSRMNLGAQANNERRY